MKRSSWIARTALRSAAQAPDPESVREAFRSAGQPFDRAWAAKVWWREE